ncbi:hypothetical protein [Maridesulfovibrio sp.]|uniref:hypothetical protein n=1 Tax=Maridesulfovibrio sp. TaxID=2795000 RepID=UPI0029C9DE10|nr:hypothetical protein [Maridesulfovibrio sp.]
MILMFGICATVILLTLFINRMITSWHRDTIKAFKREEASLRGRHAKAMEEQKKALLKLRRVKIQITNYERMVIDRRMKKGE